MNQRFLERLLALKWPTGTPRPQTLHLYSFVLAIRGWLRQIHIHSSFYKWMARQQQTAAASSRGAGEGTERELATLMAAAEVRTPGTRLEGLDRVLYHVVQKCKGDCFTSRAVNLAIKNLKYTTNSDKTPSQVAALVVNRLIEGGLAEDVEDCGGRGSGKKGRKLRKCRWKPWAAIQGNPASDAFRSRLGLGADDFA